MYLPSWDRFYEKDLLIVEFQKNVFDFLIKKNIEYYNFELKLIENGTNPKDYFSILEAIIIQ